MIPKLTTEHFFYASLVLGVLGIAAFLIYKGKTLSAGDIVPVMVIFGSSVGFVYSGCQIWYIVISKQDLGVLQNHWVSLLAGGIAVMWVAALAVIRSFKK